MTQRRSPPGNCWSRLASSIPTQITTNSTTGTSTNNHRVDTPSARLPQSNGSGVCQGPTDSGFRVPRPPPCGRHPRASPVRPPQPPPAPPGQCARTSTAALRNPLRVSSLPRSNPNDTPDPETLPRAPRARAAPRISNSFSASSIVLERVYGISTHLAAHGWFSQIRRAPLPTDAPGALVSILPGLRDG